MDMQDMMKLFSAMMSQGNNDAPDNGDADNGSANAEDIPEDFGFDFGSINFDMLSKMGELFSHMNKPDMNGELLCALRPHLRDENQHKIDTALKISRMISLFPFIKESGILNDLF
jgi:hypothetical protein